MPVLLLQLFVWYLFQPAHRSPTQALTGPSVE